MTTTQHTPISKQLRERRGDKYKSEVARTLGVSRQIYDAWETGHFVPSDDWAEQLAAYLDVDIQEVVWMLYLDRTRGDPRPEGVSSDIAPLRRQSVDYGLSPPRSAFGRVYRGFGQSGWRVAS